MSGTVKADRGRLVLVTGLSGSGKSTVAKCFEDLGYYCVDNLPLPLLRQFLADPLALVEGRDHIAVVADVRAPGFAFEAPKLWRDAGRSGLEPTLVYLESSDEALQRRFSETRRSHPLAGDGPVLEAIQKERSLLAELRGDADLILDTSALTIHEIRNLIYREFGEKGGAEPAMVVTLVSFGFKFGIPYASDLLFDVRFLPNPHFVPGLREKSGADDAVLRFLDAEDDFHELLRRLSDLLLFLLPRYKKENRKYLSIAIGCTGGRHRSVAIVERLAAALSGHGWNLRVIHRDVERERP